MMRRGAWAAQCSAKIVTAGGCGGINESSAKRPRSAMGLGCAKTPGGSVDALPLEQCEFPVCAVLQRGLAGSDYALIAAMSGRMPRMFMTRVRL
jgi:hypothetical protein